MKASTRSFNLIQFFALILFICGLVCAGGCTSAGTNIDVKQTPAISLPRYKIVAVEVTTKDPDFDSKEIGQLTGSILDGLRKSARFDKVYASSSSDKYDADLKLSVAVQFVVGANMNKVQSIETSVTLIDPADGKTLASALINSHTEWRLLGGNMTKAITRLGDQIVDFTTKL